GTSISAFGVNALEENTTGGQNNAFGSAALRFNTSGTGNSAFGNSALIANISGNANAAFGTQALQSNRASMNAAVGYQALENNTTGSGNTALGHMALTGNVDGSFNTAIGKGTGVLSTSNPSNATAIGAFARVDTSNSLVLGSIIGVNGATSSVNVGIGTTSPTRRLHVSNGASGGTSNANTGILLESDVNVYQHFLTPNNRESGLLFGSNTASIHGGIIFDNSDEDISFRTGGNTTRMTLINSGYLGIGTATPGGQLELSLDEGRKPASSTWTITSDARLKNVTGDYHKGLTEIIALKPIRYNYKNTDKRTFEQDVLNKEAYGFLAQEVQTVFPEAVGVDDDGYLNFNLHPILIASINAFKELNTKYEEVKSENEALKDKLNALLVRVEALENQ
ncbi:MAG TPA: tail fiber domain-containing protein, partial [Mangrovimonas sp.]|nr:tail fiber domain-containing protein [Mangrovimonas sp.]